MKWRGRILNILGLFQHKDSFFYGLKISFFSEKLYQNDGLISPTIGSDWTLQNNCTRQWLNTPMSRTPTVIVTVGKPGFIYLFFAQFCSEINPI